MLHEGILKMKAETIQLGRERICGTHKRGTKILYLATSTQNRKYNQTRDEEVRSLVAQHSDEEFLFRKIAVTMNTRQAALF